MGVSDWSPVETLTYRNMDLLLLALAATAALLAVEGRPGEGEVKFGDGNTRNNNNNQDVDQRFFTGNSFLDGALVGAGAGVLGGVVGKPIIDGVVGGVLGGGSCDYNACCYNGRKKDRLRIQILNFSLAPIAIIATVVGAA